MTTGSQTSGHDKLDPLLRGALKSQYQAALSMLRQAVERCPDSQWGQGQPPFWQVAYHAAFFAHFYMGADVAAFRPWKHHRPKIESLGAPPLGDPYTQVQMLDYLSKCVEMVGPAVDGMDLAAGDSSFPWYKVSKVEHQIINLRHIQHHTIYLSAMLRASGQQPVTWISPTRTEYDENAG